MIESSPISTLDLARFLAGDKNVSVPEQVAAHFAFPRDLGVGNRPPFRAHRAVIENLRPPLTRGEERLLDALAYLSTGLEAAGRALEQGAYDLQSRPCKEALLCALTSGKNEHRLAALWALSERGHELYRARARGGIFMTVLDLASPPEGVAFSALWIVQAQALRVLVGCGHFDDPRDPCKRRIIAEAALRVGDALVAQIEVRYAAARVIAHALRYHRRIVEKRVDLAHEVRAPHAEG